MDIFLSGLFTFSSRADSNLYKMSVDRPMKDNYFITLAILLAF